VRGVNAILDAVIGPLNFSAGMWIGSARATIPPQITDTYHGDFNLIKNNLNTLIGHERDHRGRGGDRERQPDGRPSANARRRTS
jgi:hypothetical protein